MNFRIRKAARIVNSGGVIAYPTEGVYGFGCLPQLNQSVERILELKKRSVKAGLILVAADREQLAGWIEPTRKERKNMRARMPHPVSWVVTAGPLAPNWITGGRPTIAVRISSHPIVAELCLAVDAPLVSTSANRSGKAAQTTAFGVRRLFHSRLDYILNGATGDCSGASEIRNAATNKVLRAG
ncbi:MAG: L-threonylcarbamoyladenylate synthase [Gammaproteobacteria bacterium]